METETPFVKINMPNNRRANVEAMNTDDGGGNGISSERNTIHSVNDIMTVIATKRTVQQREGIRKDGTSCNVPEANGSVISIVACSKKAGLDPLQRRAFKVLASSFVLTFFDEAAADGSRTKFKQQKRLLQNLAKLGSNNTQLICFLHGPGGCGKTTVMDIVTVYAKEYCELLDHPFDARTIVKTAMSRVAATLLMGNTIQNAAHLNRKVAITPEQADEWNVTWLLIVDEISFTL
jgi:predicted ATPase